MSKNKRLWSVLFFSVVFASCSKGSSDEPRQIAAATSMQPFLESIQPLLETELKASIQFVFSSSGILRTQIEQSAPYDVFVSASEKEVERLESKHKIKNHQPFAQNRLSLVSSNGAACPSFKEWQKSSQRHALGSPSTVPAGRYAKEVLRYLKLWSHWQSQLVFTENARQTVTYIQRKQVPFGLVYYSDTVHYQRHIQKCFDFPLESHSPILISWNTIRPSTKLRAEFIKSLEPKLKAYGLLAL